MFDQEAIQLANTGVVGIWRKVMFFNLSMQLVDAFDFFFKSLPQWRN